MRATRETPTARRRRRNTLLLAGLVPSICATVVALALIVMLVRDASGRAAIEEGDYDGAAGHFAGNRRFGTVERWVAPYNEGVATAGGERFADALDDFSAALDLAPRDRECLVLHNIAVVREQLGDRAVSQDEAGALDSYRRARAALASAGCLGREDSGAEVRAASTILDGRVRAKILELIDEQEQREQALLTTAERRRAERLEEADRRAEEQDQAQVSDGPTPDSEEDYAW